MLPTLHTGFVAVFIASALFWFSLVYQLISSRVDSAELEVLFFGSRFDGATHWRTVTAQQDRAALLKWAYIYI
jgi:hypothetical protein